jgi:hypothetical protein
MGFHPTNASIFWVGTPSGGIWKTTDGGGSWLAQGDGLPSMGVSSILVNPNNGDDLYISTGDKLYSYVFEGFFGGDTKYQGVT